MPGLHSMFSSSNLNPFEIFGISRQNWWEGPNVCIDRKVLTGDQEETSAEEDEIPDEEPEKRGKFFSMDTSFTTCRDDVNFHECTTKINKNGEKKSVTVRHQCCYGHQRSESALFSKIQLNMIAFKSKGYFKRVDFFHKRLKKAT